MRGDNSTDDDSDDSEMSSNESSNAFDSFETESTADKRMSRLLGEMLSDLSEEDENVNCESSEAWLAKYNTRLEALASIMTTYYIWATIDRIPSFSLLTVFNKDDRFLYKAVGRQFPALEPKGSPTQGLKELRHDSAKYRDMRSMLRKILVSEYIDIERATPVYPGDIRRLVLACAPTPRGIRDALFILILHRSGVRSCGLCRMRPSALYLSDEEDSAILRIPAQKRSGEAATAWQYIYSDAAMIWLVKKFLAVRENDRIGNGSLFGFANTTAANSMVASVCIRAGYPKQFLTVHGFKAGKMTADVFNDVVNGQDLCVAEQKARIACRMAENSNADKVYHRPIIGIAQALVGNINSISDLPMSQLHPELDEVFEDGQLPGPFRAQLFVLNEGVTPALSQILREIWNAYRDDMFEAFDEQYETFTDADYRQCLEEMSVILQQYCDDESFNMALRNLTGSGTGTEGYACIQIFNALFRMGELTATILREAGSVKVPEYMVTYFALPKVPVGYEKNLARKPKPRVDVTGKTTNHVLLKTAYKNRARPRSSLFVSIGKQNPTLMRIEEIPDETLMALDEEMRSRKKRRAST